MRTSGIRLVRQSAHVCEMEKCGNFSSCPISGEHSTEIGSKHGGWGGPVGSGVKIRDSGVCMLNSDNSEPSRIPSPPALLSHKYEVQMMHDITGHVYQHAIIRIC